jgi:hypothetical protein
MDYTTQVKLFYTWLANQHPHKAAISLWHGLMYQAVKQNKTEFIVGISTLEETTGFKRSELYEARNWLIKNKRIKCKIRGGASHCQYSITAFSVRGTDKTADTIADASADTIQPKKTAKKVPAELPFWKAFVEEWDSWYSARHGGNKYIFRAQDFAHLKKIYEFLRKRSAEKSFEFTEETLTSAFRFFLQKAWDKDNWLQQNFSIPNVLNQINQIVNGARKSKQSTGGEVSTGNLFSRINDMPD